MPADQPPPHLPGHEPYDPGLAARITVLEQLSFDTKATLERIDNRLDQMDKRLDQMDRRLDQMDRRLDQMDKRFDQMDKRFDQIETRIDRLETRIEVVQGQMLTLVEEVKKLADDRVSLFKDVAEIRGRVSQHPTTLQLLGFVIAVMAIGGFMRHFSP